MAKTRPRGSRRAVLANLPPRPQRSLEARHSSRLLSASGSRANEELSDFLGEGKGLGSLAGWGRCDAGRPGPAFATPASGYVPTPGAPSLPCRMWPDARHRGVEARSGRRADETDGEGPAPDAVFKAHRMPRPTAGPSSAVQELRDQAGHPMLWQTPRRARSRTSRCVAGWTSRAFTTRTGLGRRGVARCRRTLFRT